MSTASHIQPSVTANRFYWLYLHPYVIVTVKKAHAILYNTENHSLFEYPAASPQYQLLKQIAKHTQLYVVSLSSSDITPAIAEFIQQIRHSFSGDIQEAIPGTTKPIQLKPLLSLQKTLRTLTTGADQPRSLADDEITDYLSSITLYLNNSCSQTCPQCAFAYHQTIHCHKAQKAHQLSINALYTLIEQTQNSKLFKLNISGGDILAYSFLQEAMLLFNALPILKDYYLHYLNIQAQSDFYTLFHEGANALVVLVHFPLDIEIFHQQIRILKDQGLFHKVNIRFLIQSQSDIQQAEIIIAQLHCTQYSFIPYYNQANLSFFEENVFITRDSILESKPQMHDIFARSVLNTQEFKKLTLFYDCSVYANMNFRPIGKLGEEHLMEIVYRALHQHPAWTRVRQHVFPCKSCAFQLLCPPISNYDYAIGQYNLCHLHQSPNPQ